mmetsp:Transcript_2512/g.7066  ORF Transcript_2512/g.7066 Transcript_2512/m.7066 type:complete len:210 (-) Transcript_2512:957-1586(-)
MHAVPCPLPLILPPIPPRIHPLSMHVVVQELALVDGTICPSKPSSPMFVAAAVLTAVLGTIGPGLNATAMLLILRPTAVIRGAIRAVVYPSTVRLASLPFSLVHITLCMVELPLTLGLTIPPGALVAGSIGPDLDPVAVLGVAEPLTCVLGSGFYAVRGPLLPGAVGRGVAGAQCTGLVRARCVPAEHVRPRLTYVRSRNSRQTNPQTS